MTGDNGGTTALELEVLGPDDVVIPVVTNYQEIEVLAARYSGEAQVDLDMAQAVVVDSDQKYEEAGTLRVAIDKKRAGGEGIVETICGPLYKRWKEWRGLFMRPVELRQQAAAILGSKRLTYQKAKEAEAERIRLENERLAREEQERLNKNADRRADRAEANGDTERAEEIRANVPQVTPAPVPVAPPPKTAGVAKNTYWHAGIIGCNQGKFADVTRNPGPARDRALASFLQLVTAVAAGEVPIDALLPNESWLNKTAAALKMAMKYPGVQVYSEERERSTGR